MCSIEYHSSDNIISWINSTLVLLRVKVRTASDVVIDEEVGSLLRAEVFYRITPEQITHWTGRRWLLEPVNLKKTPVSSAVNHSAVTGIKVLEIN